MSKKSKVAITPAQHNLLIVLLLFVPGTHHHPLRGVRNENSLRRLNKEHKMKRETFRCRPWQDRAVPAHLLGLAGWLAGWWVGLLEDAGAMPETSKRIQL